MKTPAACRNLTLTAFAACLALPALAADAATVAYWRFEDAPGFTADSSGNGRSLTVTTSGQVSQVAIPGSGSGSAFPNPVPQTATANSKMASLTINDGSSLSAADSNAFTDTSFSVEGLFNIAASSDDAQQKVLVSHFNNTGDQRSWAFYVDGSSNLILLLNNLGTSAANEFIDSGFDIAEGVDYYLGVTIDLSLGTSSEVTFYLKNLTSGGVLQSSNFASAKTGLFNSSASLFIGDYANQNQDVRLAGLVDEVRISDVKLSQSELLIVPEPAALALMGLGVLCMLPRRGR